MQTIGRGVGESLTREHSSASTSQSSGKDRKETLSGQIEQKKVPMLLHI